ncbi:glycoside hydrolase [Rhodofomes roseus]|uniref:alpha-1,2-Mannosidase n=1 Tax=Rhodofomes roseus TaxID=34475 RepID=A0ABQ8K858_9APHY|nr:glycoside hydrolase [Rhodofomes roseus]KAH9833334.1 glycoside hydrolase [Rhodofomes roseus]
MLGVGRRLGVAALALACMGVKAGPVQAPIIIPPPYAAEYAQKTVQMFQTSWSAYKEYAWGHDDLSPVSESYSDSYGGWGASIVDALDTIYIMGLTDIFEEALNWSSTVDYSTTPTDSQISLFETTIRYVAASLCTYELSGQKYPQLVNQSQVIVDKMVNAFVRDNQIPYGYLNWNEGTPVQQTTNIAEAGTLTMEWGTLTDYTGNDTYRALAEKSVVYIANLPPPLPNLPAQVVDPTSGEFADAYVTWGGGSDSYFEYLIKYARLTNTDNNLFADTWASAVDSSIWNLARSSTVEDWQYMADWDNGTIIHIGSHLECFHAGNWMLGGKLLNNETIVNWGLALMEACWNTYASTATGLGPEVFGYSSSDGNYTGTTPSTGDLAFYAKHGFFVYPGDSDYYLRPEVLESNFYAWRITGNWKYVQRAADAVDSFLKYLPTTVAYAGIDDVDATDSAFIDDMQSFWYAEVLKYLYLTFSDPSLISLDEYVFNTEGHPFKAPPAKPVYGSGQILESDTSAFKMVVQNGPIVSPVPSAVVSIQIPSATAV